MVSGRSADSVCLALRTANLGVRTIGGDSLDERLTESRGSQGAPDWSPDGRFLLSNSLDFSEPTALFKVPGPRGSYDMAIDGTRILALTPIGNEAPWSMTLVVNWPALLKK